MVASNTPLQPQRARDYNLGFDISPPFIKGLSLHMTYFNIDYRGTIGQPPLGFGQFYPVPAFQPLYQMLPTIPQMQAFLLAHGASQTQVDTVTAQVIGLGGNPYVVADVRQRL